MPFAFAKKYSNADIGYGFANPESYFPISITGILDKSENSSETNGLLQNYPNTFNPSTTINYSIPIKSYVKLIIYDILGNKISTLIDEHQNTGKYMVKFNAQNMARGIYFYKLDTRKHFLIKNIILLH